ncbi:MAG: TIGR00268 family protein, partial [bacterium (Candidatus Ratteibacteria) CG01_land_8_20_14_3_00_40_19]
MSKKLQRLKEILTKMESVLIAYSGGVDSTFLLKVARDVLKDKVIAVMANSLTYPSGEIDQAEIIAEALGVRYIIIETKELKNSKFSGNSKDRCYWCKRELFSQLSYIAKKEGLKYVADGTNFDDTKDYRPGT